MQLPHSPSNRPGSPPRWQGIKENRTDGMSLAGWAAVAVAIMLRARNRARALHPRRDGGGRECSLGLLALYDSRCAGAGHGVGGGCHSGRTVKTRFWSGVW